MAGRRPKWQIFKTVKGQKIDYKNDKIGALWAGENQYGEFFTGKIGDDSVVVYANKFYNQEEDGPDGEGHDNSDTSSGQSYVNTGDPEGSPAPDDDLPF